MLLCENFEFISLIIFTKFGRNLFNGDCEPPQSERHIIAWSSDLAVGQKYQSSYQLLKQKNQIKLFVGWKRTSLFG